MIVPFAAWILAQEDARPVLDFFPLTPGIKRVYSTQVGGTTAQTTDTVLPPTKIGPKQDIEAIPIETSARGRRISTVYYQVAGNTIQLIATDPKAPFDLPRPVFVIGEPTGSLTYDGQEGAIPLTMTGTSRAAGRRKVLDQEVDTIELRLEAKLDQGIFEEKISQVALYGRGIGLFEMRETRQTKRTKSERTVRLVAFTPAPDGGNR